MTDPRVSLSEPCFGKLVGDLSAEIVAVMSGRGEPVQQRLPPLVLSGEYRFTVEPGGEPLVDLPSVSIGSERGVDRVDVVKASVRSQAVTLPP